MTVARCSYSVDQRPWCLTAVSFFTQRNFSRHSRDFSIWRGFNSSRNYATPISLKCPLKRIRNKKAKFSLLFVFSLRQKVLSFRSAKGHSEFKRNLSNVDNWTIRTKFWKIFDRKTLNLADAQELVPQRCMVNRKHRHWKLSQLLPLGPLADASVVTDDGFGARCGSLSPTSSVADLRPNCDAAVDKFSVSISSFLLNVKMGSLGRPLRCKKHLDEDSPIGYYKAYYSPFLCLLLCITLSVNCLPWIKSPDFFL